MAIFPFVLAHYQVIESFHCEPNIGRAQRGGSPRRGAPTQARRVSGHADARVTAAGPDIIRIGRGRATCYGLRQSWPALTPRVFRSFESPRTERPDRLAISPPWLRVRRSGCRRHRVEWPPDRARRCTSIGIPGAALCRDSRRSPAARARGRLVRSSHSDRDVAAGEDCPAISSSVTNRSPAGRRSRAWTGRAMTIRELAEATIAGHPPGSSAGGERPKFGVLVDGRHMLVKFAARGGAGDAAARRWCDLLVLEALALNVVSSRGISVARSDHRRDAVTLFSRKRAIRSRRRARPCRGVESRRDARRSGGFVGPGGGAAAGRRAARR